MSNGIDFVIGGKDQAKPAMSSVEKSLTRLEQKTDSLKKSTLSLSKVTGALAAAYVAVKASMAWQSNGVEAVKRSIRHANRGR
jgi:ABC-type enterochelin transport system substrate-binding protein